MFALLLTEQARVADWQAQVRDHVQARNFQAALAIVEKRLGAAPSDVEAAGWHARLKAWSGRWSEAEAEYGRLLERFPGDFDASVGLADVLFWQGRLAESRAALKPLLRDYSNHPEVRRRLARLASEELRPCEIAVGYGSEVFSFAGAAHTGRVGLRCSIAKKWNWQMETSSRSRFGQYAQRFGAGLGLRRGRHGFHLAAARSTHSDVFPLTEGEVGYTLGLPRLELDYTHRWMAFRSAVVQVANPSAIYYLPREVQFTLSLFAGRTRPDAVPEPVNTLSGYARLSFPIRSRVRLFALYAVGAESFQELTLDRAGRFAARSYAAGAGLRTRPGEAVDFFIQHRRRSGGAYETGVTLGYSFRF